MNNRFRIIVIVMLFSSFALNAQRFQLRVTVLDTKQQPIEFSTLALLLESDTTKKLMSITDSNGVALFELNTKGNYVLRSTAIGFTNTNEVVKVVDSSLSVTVTMPASNTALNEVVIQSAKPLMRQVDDRTVIDPESLVASSTNGYEVLEKTPGLFIDNDGNIYLSSATPATVYINGREMKMSRNDIATMLKSLPPNAIEKIEILRTPSARYDASGSGGVVNVVLKKGFKIGLTGSINTGIQQGRYGNKFAGVNIANNDGKTSMYLNLNYTRRNTYETVTTNRMIGNDTLIAQEAYTKFPGNVGFVGYGLGYDFTDNFNVSYDGRVSYNDFENTTTNTNNFLKASTQELLGGTVANLTNFNKSYIINQDINAKYKIDTAGSEWVNSLSYIYANSPIEQLFNTQSAIPYGGDGTVKSIRHFIAFQSDLTYKFAHEITMETGIKSTYLSFINEAAYFLNLGSNRVEDLARTNKYNYTENINAAYLQGSKPFYGFLLKAGVRMEHTNMNGLQTVPSDTSFSINRVDFFPYVYFSRKLMSIANFDLRAFLVYRRSITRPTYEQLNPFPKYVDQFLSEVGNPTLKPQFTTNYEANISVNEWPVLAIGYNDTRDLFTNVYYQSESNQALAFRTFDNIGQNKEIYFRAIGAIPPGKRYFFVLGGQYNHNIYDGMYEGVPTLFRGNSFLMFTYQQLKLDKKSQLSLNGFWRFKGVLQFTELGSFGQINLNLNRRFFNDKLTVTVSVNDLFYTNNFDFAIRQASVSAEGYRASDSRRFGINLRYNFGFTKKEEDKNMFNMPQQE